MATTTPNPEVRQLTDINYLSTLSVHPDYTYWAPQWKKIRDAELGEIEIKRKAETYLPKLPSHNADQYKAYLHRAVFFNMTSRTLNALYGTMFSRSPKITGLAPKVMEKTKNISKDTTSLHLLTKTAVKEVLAVGRYGILVDAAPSGAGDPYLAGYTTENILDWNLEEINGRMQLARVVLRELFYGKDVGMDRYEYKARYRVLTLVDGIYQQYVYEDRDSLGIVQVPESRDEPDDIVTPTVRGQPLKYIPFIIIGPFTNHPDVEKPPMLDIVTLNLSHYLSYAQLEQGRFYTGAPIYTVQTGAYQGEGEGSEYVIGPDVLWKLGTGEEAKILEFNGQGLRFLENALADKEAQISAIGGRMMPGNARGAAESDNSLALKERNEQTMLLNLADTVDEAITQLLSWWADWLNVPKSKLSEILFELNRDFLMKNAGAREFRAIQQMYENGVIPVDVVYDYLRKSEVIPDWMSEEEFTQRLEDSKQFPNMVDVLARMKNYPDAKAFHEFEMARQGITTQGKSVLPSPQEKSELGVPQQTKEARIFEGNSA